MYDQEGPRLGTLPIVPRGAAGRKFVGRCSRLRTHAAYRGSARPGAGIIAWHRAVYARPKRAQAHRSCPYARALCADHGRCGYRAHPRNIGKEFRGSCSRANCRQRNHWGGECCPRSSPNSVPGTLALLSSFPCPTDWRTYCDGMPISRSGWSDPNKALSSLGALEASPQAFMRTVATSMSAASPTI